MVEKRERESVCMLVCPIVVCCALFEVEGLCFKFV